uniref:Uncharacterized protein n=1 Tax=Esox lucius TaxID=8010 RepID=A0A3P9A892_ESOLU
MISFSQLFGPASLQFLNDIFFYDGSPAVEDAMRLNKKLTSVNTKQESTIISLKRDVQELNNKLVKVKVSSLGRSEENNNLTVKEQRIQQLQHRLNVETEMNTKLREEHVTERAGKREVMSSLQHAQQLLLTQTQAVSRLELELEALREEYQALKREQELTREKTQGNEARFADLIEEYRHSRMIWENEKLVLLERIQCERQDLISVNHDQLPEKHTELSSYTMLSAEPTQGLKSGLEHDKDRSPDNEWVTKDIPTEDTVIVDGEALTVQSDYVADVSDRISYVGPLGCLETVIDNSPQTSNCKVVFGIQTTHVSTLDPECHDVEGGGDGRSGKDKPSSVLRLPAGDSEGLPPPQSGSEDGQATLTDVVHVLSICGAGEVQTADSNKKPVSCDPVSALIDNVCPSSGDHLSNKGDSKRELSGSENRSVYGALDSDLVAGGTRDAEQEPSMYTPGMTACQTTDKHGGSQTFQDVDPVQADVPLTVPRSSGPCGTLPLISSISTNVGEIDMIRCHAADGDEAVIPAEESPRSPLSAAVSRNSNTHTGNLTGEELSRTSLHSEPRNLPQINSPWRIMALDFARSDCDTGTEHKQPTVCGALVTADVVDSKCQGTLSECGHASPDDETRGDVPEQPSSCVDFALPVGSQARHQDVVNLPQSERLHEGHCPGTAVDQLRPTQANDGDAEVTQNQPINLTSKPQSDETDFSAKISLSRQSDSISSEEETSEIIEYLFLPSEKIYQSSFELTTKKRDILSRNMQGIAVGRSPLGSWPTTSASPVTTPVSDLKTKLSSEFQEPPPPPITIPVFLKGKKNTSDPPVMTGSGARQDIRSLLTSHQRHNQEWNSIRENLNEVSAEKEDQVHVPVSSVLPNTLTTSSMGSSRSWQNTQTVSSPCQPSPNRTGSSDAFAPISQEKGHLQKSDIRTQIDKIEELLGSERLRLSKRHKME